MLDDSDLMRIEYLLIQKITELENALKGLHSQKLANAVKERKEEYESTAEKIIGMRYLK